MAIVCAPSLSSPRKASKAAIYLWVALGTLLVGAIDYATGVEIHVTSLYFIPLAAAGWRLGRVGAVIASLFSAAVWFFALYFTAVHFASYVWIANVITQLTAFLSVSLLVAMLNHSLARERGLSGTDYLTGLRNRRAFIEHANAALLLCRRHGRPVALAYIDLDNFKQVNDSLGHARGDTVLGACAKTIGALLRESDIPARFGGDEFAVFLPEASAESALAVLDRIRNAIALAKETQGIGVTASIGLVVDESASCDIDELLQRADAQMFVAKSNGNRAIVVCRIT